MRSMILSEPPWPIRSSLVVGCVTPIVGAAFTRSRGLELVLGVAAGAALSIWLWRRLVARGRGAWLFLLVSSAASTALFAVNLITHDGAFTQISASTNVTVFQLIATGLIAGLMAHPSTVRWIFPTNTGLREFLQRSLKVVGMWIIAISLTIFGLALCAGFGYQGP